MKLTRSRYGRLIGLTTLLHLPMLLAQDILDSGIDALDPVVVIGDVDDGFEAFASGKLAGSYDIIKRDQLIYEHPDDTLELFSKVPGVTLSRYNQGIINTDISIRGFAGDGTTPHGKLLIDGIPSNLHNGFNELDQMFPLAIGGIEVFKGTGDVRFGLYNIAGNYQVSSRTDLAREIQLTYGSFDAREIQAYWGLKSGNLTHNYFLGWRESNGYRDHTDLRKYTLSGRWSYEFDDATRLSLIARTSSYDGESPGYLDRETARTDPRSSAEFASEDGGEKSVDHISLHFDKELLGGDLTFSAKAYYQNFERNRWVRFSEAGSLRNRIDDQDMSGLITSLEWNFHDQWTLRAGLDYEYQDVLEQRFQVAGNTREGAIERVRRNHRYDLEILGGFVSVEHNPTDWLRWNAGVRLDHLDGDFENLEIADATRFGEVHDFGVIVQPKVNLFVSLSDSLTAFANAGRSFQHPFGAALYTNGDRSIRDVSINDGWEVGFKWDATDDLSLRASYWQQQASDEFVVVDDVPRNVGETDREGIDLSLSWNPSEQLSLWGNYSYTSSEIVSTDSTRAATRGNRLRGVPDYTFSIGGSYHITESLTARLHVDGQGSYFVNENNQGGTFGGYTLVNAGIDYEKDWGRLSLQLNNLLDRDFEYVFDFGDTGAATIHSPGDGINASLSYTYEF